MSRTMTASLRREGDIMHRIAALVLVTALTACQTPGVDYSGVFDGTGGGGST